MGTLTSRKVGCLAATAAVAFLGSASAGAAEESAAAGTSAAPATAETAVWTAKKFNFVYMGFTTKYSCDGLRSKVKEILLTLGARKDDLVVAPSGCSHLTGPEPFPGVNVKMSVLEPAKDSSASTVPAHWKSVEVKADADPLSRSGQCELVEQLKKSVLPQFSTRAVEFSSLCPPHQLTLAGAMLKAEVLQPDKTDREAVAAATEPKR